MTIFPRLCPLVFRTVAILAMVSRTYNFLVAVVANIAGGNIFTVQSLNSCTQNGNLAQPLSC